MTRIFFDSDHHSTLVQIPDYLQNLAPKRLICGIDGLDRDFGGIPIGKITEILGVESSGKTRLALHIAKQVLSKGGNVLYFDADQTLMSKDIPEHPQFVLSRINKAKDVFDMILQALKSKAFSLIITDSLYSLISPQDVYVQDQSLSQLLSEYIPQFEYYLNLCPDTGLIFLQRNMFMNGCLHGNTLIPFTNGKVYSISQIVDKRLRGKVYSIDEQDNVQANEIQDWHNHGVGDENCPFMFLSARHENGWQSKIFLTENHPVHSPEKGWVAVSDLRENDSISGRYINFLNKENKEFLRGCLLGSAHFHFNREFKRLELFLSARQGTPLSLDVDYMRFKAEKLSCYGFKERGGVGGKYWVSSFTYSDDFYRLREEKETFDKTRNKRSNNFAFYENLSDKEMAIWFADTGEIQYTEDGWEFSVPLPTRNEQQACEYVKRVKESGYPVYVWGVLSDTDNSITEYRMAFKDETPLRLMMIHLPSGLVRKYFKFALDYFNISDKGNISHLPLMSHPVVYKGEFTVLSIQKMSDTPIKKNPNRYDLTVKRHANYLAGGLGGIFVHNSPSNTLSRSSHSRILSTADENGKVSCKVIKDKDISPTGNTYPVK